jgi:hypothetical protein
MELKHVLQAHEPFNFAQDFAVFKMYQNFKYKQYSLARICEPINFFTTSQIIISNMVKTSVYKFLVCVLHLHTIGAIGIDVKNT